MIGRSFLIVEGLWDENGVFWTRRVHESPVARTAISLVENPKLVLRLVDKAGAVLTEAAVDARFPQGCQACCRQVGLGLIRAAIALHPDAKHMELVAGTRVVMRFLVGDKAPRIDVPKVTVDANGVLRAEWATHGDVDDVHASLVIGAREHFVELPAKASTATIDLARWAGRGAATLRLAATLASRTATVSSAPFQLPVARAHGRILAPRPGETWSLLAPRSLVANLSDQNGRAMPWQGVFWTIDGTRIDDTGSIAEPGSLTPGVHVIALVLDSGRQLDKVEVRVLEESPEEAAWSTALERALASEARRTSQPATRSVGPGRTRAAR